MSYWIVTNDSTGSEDDLVEEAESFIPMEEPHQLQDEQLKEIYQVQTGCRLGKRDRSIFQLLNQREYKGFQGNPSYMYNGFTPSKRVHCSQRIVPNNNSGRPLMKYNHSIFRCEYSNDGKLFMSATQDRRIRFYDTTSWQQKQQVFAHDVGWSIIDTQFSPDQRWLMYSGWSNAAHLVNIGGEHQVHESLKLTGHDIGDYVCFFSVKFSPDNNEVLAGCNDYCLYVYDLNRRETNFKVRAHNNDINTVAYADNNNNNMIISGGDDCLCKVWDRRCIDSNTRHPVGVMVGHHQGITHVHSKGDGTYFISSGKDHTIKLWDIRKMNTDKQASRKFQKETYDYRNRMSFFNYKDENDNSVMSYKGHTIARTLIRCYFSPQHTTGQKYIYTGSADGIVRIYDVVSGKVVESLKGHTDVIRDLSWHPYEPTLITSSWDSTMNLYDHQENLGNTCIGHIISNQSDDEYVEDYDDDDDYYDEDADEVDEDDLYVAMPMPDDSSDNGHDDDDGVS